MTLLQMSISGAVLITVIALLRALLLRAVPKRTFLLLWTVALLRLLVPLAPVFSVPMPDMVPKPILSAPAATADAGNPAPDAAESVAAPSLPLPIEPSATAPESPDTPSAVSAQDTLRRSLPWHTVWLAGSIFCGAAFVCLYAANYRRFRGAGPMTQDAAAAWLDTHPLRRPLSIKTLRGIDSPLTCGVLRPVILVPEGFDFADNASRYALEHEYVHALRFDTAFKLALAAALAVHWCNPAVWLLYVLANRDIELSCDEAVLRRFGEGERGAYARALLAMEEKRSALPALYAGFGANPTEERILAIMKYKKPSVRSLVLAAALVLSLAACAATTATAETPASPTGLSDTSAPAPIGELPDGAAYLNGGMTLTIPAEYRGLVLVDMPEENENGTLFTVSEKASVEAAEAEGHGDWGMGWLFSVARISTEELDELMCADMSGVEVIAKDVNGGCYMLYRPTDVRFYRVGDAYQNDQDGWAQWEKLNDWAWKDVRQQFLAENRGLTPFSVTNSGVDIYLARLACWDDIEYTLGSVAFGQLSPEGVDAAPYVERLRNGVTFEAVDTSRTPDGEFFVLFFPDGGGGERFDFFAAGGNYVRQVYGPNGEYQILYKATYADGTTESNKIVAEWYDALVKAHGLL